MLKTHRLGSSLLLAGCALIAQRADAVTSPDIKVLGTRADLVSGGDALVEVTFAPRATVSAAKYALNGIPLTGVFALRPNGKVQGLVTGLRAGFNVLTVRAPGTTRCAAAPPKRPRTGPKQRAPGTKTRSPTVRPDLFPARAMRPTDS